MVLSKRNLSILAMVKFYSWFIYTLDNTPMSMHIYTHRNMYM